MQSHLIKFNTRSNSQIISKENYTVHNVILCALLVNRIKEETKTAIIIPNDSEKKSLIRIEGSPQGVAKAKAEILEMAKKLVSSEKYTLPLPIKYLSANDIVNTFNSTVLFQRKTKDPVISSLKANSIAL